jgi:signal peptidase I
MEIMNSPEVVTRNKENNSNSILSWVRFFVTIGAVFIIFRYGIGLNIVHGNSMNPTVENKDIVISTNIFYSPERGDVVIARDPNGFDIIKRVIGLPNDTIEIKDGNVFINDQLLSEEYTKGISNDISKVKIPENHYFLIGDNRTAGESLDSRSQEMGPVPGGFIKGETFLSLFNFKFL